MCETKVAIDFVIVGSEEKSTGQGEARVFLCVLLETFVRESQRRKMKGTAQIDVSRIRPLVLML